MRSCICLVMALRNVLHQNRRVLASASQLGASASGRFSEAEVNEGIQAVAEVVPSLHENEEINQRIHDLAKLFAQEHGDVLQAFLREKLGTVSQLEVEYESGAALAADHAPERLRQQALPPLAGSQEQGASVSSFFRWVWQKITMAPRIASASLGLSSSGGMEQAPVDEAAASAAAARVPPMGGTTEFIGTATASLAILIVVYMLYARQKS
mmetsp:Transcript_14614/g.57369  ORF Transcript_14614/g.57369 Transcript_14614/m.57369 type:complete len:211 (+) Transcript_14614:11-643(+)